MFFRCLAVSVVIGGLLVGCGSPNAIEKRALVSSVAIDRAKDGYQVYAQVLIPSQVVSGSGVGENGESNAVQVFSGKGKTCFEALSVIQSQISYPLFFGHMWTMLLGENVARAGVGEILNEFRRDYHVQRQLWPVVIKGKAENGIRNYTKSNQIPAYYLQDMLETDERTGRILDTSLGEVLMQISTRYLQSPVMNYVDPQKNGYTWKGMGMFKGDRMVGVLSKEEVSLWTQIRDQQRGSMILFMGDTGMMAFQPTQVQRTYTVTKGPAIRIDVDLRGYLLNHSNTIPEARVIQRMARFCEEKARALVKKGQREGVDLFQVGKQLYLKSPKMWKQNKHRVTTIPIDVHYNVMLDENQLG